MKYTCTTCRQPFNTEPYELNRQGIFCKRDCYETWRDDHEQEAPKPNGNTYRGTNIKKH